MSARAPAWFERKYVKGVIKKLQSIGWMLRPLVNSTGTIKGNEVVWKIAGSGTATEMSPATEDRPTMNADRQNILATMKFYEANEWIGARDLEQMPENEQQVAQETAAMALGRKFDQLMLGEMEANVGSMQAQVGDGTTALSITHVITGINKIAKLMGAGSRFVCPLPFDQLSQLELYREFASSDYVGDEYPLLKEAGARRWRGTYFVPMPDDYFAVPASNQVRFYIYAMRYMGFAPNYNLRSRIDYVPVKKDWFAGNDMGLAQKILDPLAFVPFVFPTNIALARPSP
jgi:hypothetical protein